MANIVIMQSQYLLYLAKKLQKNIKNNDKR